MLWTASTTSSVVHTGPFSQLEDLRKCLMEDGDIVINQDSLVSRATLAHDAD